MSEVWSDRLFNIAPWIAGVAAAAMLYGVDLTGGAIDAREHDAAPVIAGTPTLVMIETESCGWCKRFRRDVAPQYESSWLESKAPLRYVHSRDQDNVGLRLRSRARGVPTFILVDRKGYEIDRLRGYPGGPSYFFPIIEAMLEKAPPAP